MLQRKRVLVVSRSTIAHEGAGGMEGVLDDLLNSLSEKDFELGLLTTPGTHFDGAEQPFSRIWTVSGAKSGKYSLRWWIRSAASNSPWATWNPDVIFSVSSAAASFCLVRKWSGVPIVSQCHGTAWHEVKSSASSLSIREIIKVPLNLSRILRERIAYRRFTLTVAVGPGVAHQLLRRPLAVSPSKVRVIANAVDSGHWGFDPLSRQSIRTEFNIPRHAPVSVFCGRLHRQKGADLAIYAMALLPNADWHMLICGEGPESENLHNLVVKLGLQSRVHFTGRVGSQRLASMLSAADLMIFPTRRKEGLPMNVLEALASGLNVITVPNANLPPELAELVVSSCLDTRILAADWAAVETSRSRTSRLPEVYEKGTAVALYRRLLLDI